VVCDEVGEGENVLFEPPTKEIRSQYRSQYAVRTNCIPNRLKDTKGNRTRRSKHLTALERRKHQLISRIGNGAFVEMVDRAALFPDSGSVQLNVLRRARGDTRGHLEPEKGGEFSGCVSLGLLSSFPFLSLSLSLSRSLALSLSLFSSPLLIPLPSILRSSSPLLYYSLLFSSLIPEISTSTSSRNAALAQSGHLRSMISPSVEMVIETEQQK
jgi:hypothetical protein